MATIFRREFLGSIGGFLAALPFVGWTGIFARKPVTILYKSIDAYSTFLDSMHCCHIKYRYKVIFRKFDMTFRRNECMEKFFSMVPTQYRFMKRISYNYMIEYPCTLFLEFEDCEVPYDLGNKAKVV